MKKYFASAPLWWAVAITLLAGCASHRINWNTRVGSYTFDQAVLEFGPPDKQAKLSDGKLVAEWVSRYYNSSSVVVGSGMYGYPGSGAVVQTTPNYSESKLRLTFGTNDILAGWSKN